VPEIITPPSSTTPAPARARLLYGVDATASREAGWVVARELQAKMFREAGSLLSLRLVFYGGNRCRKSVWCTSGEELARLMHTVSCEAGPTMIEKILRHGLSEHAQAPLRAITFIGDAMEENLDILVGIADQLGAVGVPIHMFQEGNALHVRKAFRLLALRSGGTYSEFNPTVPASIERLSAQLNEVARVAVNSVKAIGTTKKK
jgi:hypothetical protein